MKIAVVGPIPKDHITTANGVVIEKYGAVTHPAIALSKLVEEDGEVIPIVHVRKQDEKAIKDLLRAYPNINLSGIYSDKDMGDEIQLHFLDQNNRLERQTAFMPAIMPEDMEPFLDCDAFVFVPITDYEVPVDTLRYVREHSEGVIIFDAHGPTTSVTITGERLRRYWFERDLWLPYMDILKMNIEEATCSYFEWKGGLQSTQQAEEMEREDMDKFAQHCLNKGLKSLIITLDARGCMVYWNNDRGEMQAEFVKSMPVKEVIDTTGCGDSFAGGLSFGLVQHPNNYIKAAHFGNALGAQRTQGKTFEVFKSRSETVAMIRKNYGS